MMNKLRVLILWWTTYPVGTSRTFLNDFDTVREWAKLCPSLLYVVFPLSKSRPHRRSSRFPLSNFLETSMVDAISRLSVGLQLGRGGFAFLKQNMTSLSPTPSLAAPAQPFATTTLTISS